MLLKVRAGMAAVALGLAMTLAACGGGGGGGGSNGGGGNPLPPPPPAPAPLTDAEAARFLTQATFGATDADINAVKASGISAWITQQEDLAPAGLHQTYVDNRLSQLKAIDPKATLNSQQFYETFWGQAAVSQDQLRQRVKFALSEIFVISLADNSIDVRGAASYYDMLGANAFSNFRTLLENVTLHPMMGVYLTSIANQKEDLATGRHPDENYAREVMQLMTIGLYRLNADGTRQLDAGGAPMPSYNADDISNLAKVFTGISWYSPTPNNNTFFGGNKNVDAAVTPMIFYPAFHSTSSKTFLGTTIAASGAADTAGDLKIALDLIFNNPNVGPFISKQLIQRLVTSNPSPGYVGRVASVFNNDGAGVRGNMREVIRAILTDTEARDPTTATGASYGKAREPIVRLGNWMRTFSVSSASGNYLINSTSASTSFGQSPLTAGSVFNFYRPGYIPANTRVGGQGLTAPEFQIVDEITIAGYLNTMLNTINNGIGSANDIKSTYSSEVAVANDPNALVDRMNRLLLYGQMSATLRSKIVEAVTAVTIPGGAATQAQIDAALLNRAKLAVFMTMASPEYIIQR